MAEKRYRFNHIADKIVQLLKDEGVYSAADVDIDQYNNTIKVYYESTQEWDDITKTWMVIDDEDN